MKKQLTLGSAHKQDTQAPRRPGQRAPPCAGLGPGSSTWSLPSGSDWGARLTLHGTHISPSAQPPGALRGLQTHRETEVDRQDSKRQTQGEGRAEAHQLEREWSGAGRALRPGSFNGPPGASGPLLSGWAAGTPPPHPTQRARRRPCKPRPRAALTRREPRLAAPPPCAPSWDAGQSGGVPACVALSPASPPGKSRGCEVAGGEEGGRARCCLWSKLAPGSRRDSGRIRVPARGQWLSARELRPSGVRLWPRESLSKAQFPPGQNG